VRAKPKTLKEFKACAASYRAADLVIPTTLQSKIAYTYFMALRRSFLRLYHNCDSTTIQLQHDYDEKLTCSFFARVEWKHAARAIRRSRIVVVS